MPPSPVTSNPADTPAAPESRSADASEKAFGSSTAISPETQQRSDQPSLSAPVIPGRQSVVVVLLFFAVLYLARDLFLPLVLAGLLSFLLAPVVKGLERLRFPRVVSVIIVTVLAFALLGGLVWLIGKQVTELAARLPDYKANLTEKAAALKIPANNPIARASRTIGEIVAETKTPEPASIGTEPRPMRVEIVPSQTFSFGNIGPILLPLAAPLGQSIVVIVLVIFMLLGREDLRDRLIHLAGRNRLRLTTQALDDAGHRVSRYLLAETLINVAYGVVTGTGLYFIGIPNAMLWGVFAGLLRFLPYVGPWLGAAGPFLLALAISDSWRQPLLTLSLFIVIEIIGNNFVEPWVYGTSTGLSPLAIIVSAFFWTWLWGALGLVMATPLTVCAVVLAQHIPRLSFLDVLLARKPPISNADRVYQRLLAGDAGEAIEIVETEAATLSLAEAFDRTTLAALRAAENEFQDGLMPADVRESFFKVLRRLVTTLGDANRADSINHTSVLCLPASDEADEMAALMLQQSLLARGFAAEVASSRKLIAEMVADATTQSAAVIVISTVCPDATLAGVSLCHRLRGVLPDAFLIAGTWLANEAEDDPLRVRLEKAGASLVCHTLERAVAAVTSVAV